MDKKKWNIIMVILCVLLIVMGVFIFIGVFSKNNIDTLDINNDDILAEENINNIIEEENNDINKDFNEEIVNVNDNITVNNQNNYSEEDVVNYFEKLEYEVGNSTEFKDKFKQYFVDIIDFIFYDKDVNGYNFSELTNTAKVKIIAVALKLDTKIDEFVPKYKEDISSATGKVYDDIKDRLVISYMDISSVICKANAEECSKVKDIFGDVKDYCMIGWDFIKGLFKNGTSKIRDWYEIYSGK